MGYGIFNQYDVLINIEKSEKEAEIYLSEIQSSQLDWNNILFKKLKLV